MPSVMRRSTRVFVPKSKDGEGVRVLRSGRRLWIESNESKTKTGGGGGKNGVDLFRLINNADEAASPRPKENGCQRKVGKGRKPVVLMEIDEEAKPEQATNRVPPGESMELGCEDKFYGIVYSRKRRRSSHLVNSEFAAASEADSCGDKGSEGVGGKKYGLQFFRRQRRRTEEREMDGSKKDKICERSLCVSVESSLAKSCRSTSLLTSLLRYMSVVKIELADLASFLLLQPLSGAFASCGIHFFWGGEFDHRYGICKMYGTKESGPTFYLNFSFVPLCFTRLHVSMWLTSAFLTHRLLISLVNPISEEEDDSDLDDDVQIIRIKSIPLQPIATSNRNTNSGDLKVTNPAVGIPRSPIRSLPYRNGITSRLGQKSRRRSLRTRRARNPSLLGVHRGSAALFSDFGVRKNAAMLTQSESCNYEAWNSTRKSSNGELKILKSSLISMGSDIDTVSCFANFLVIKTDRCYRETGTCVVLQLSSAGEWVLAVKKDGSLRCSHKAQRGREVKPSCTNRYTHSIIWAVENGWKLEFTERRDWVIFKELYRVCGERNVIPPSTEVNAIPIPGVHEASVSMDTCVASFVRPESYIKVNEDELSRTLLKRTANYDMDSEDEEWLNTFNNRSEQVLKPINYVMGGTFELMVDAFEKASYCSPDDCINENAAVNLCVELGGREVVEAVYSYYIRKRKKKGAPLIRAFQLNQPMKSPLVSKSVLRKKRSIKQRQHTSHSAKAAPTGRGKEICLLQAMVAEKHANEERNAMLKVEEARDSAKRLVEVAVAKRQRAQILMGSADLAVYRASMALRLAEAAQGAVLDQAASQLIN